MIVEMAKTMKQMAAELISTKEEIKKMYEILRAINAKRDGITVYTRAG